MSEPMAFPKEKSSRTYKVRDDVVAGAGFEPTTFGL